MSSVKIKKNVEKTRQRIRKLTTKYQHEKEKVKLGEDNIQKIGQIVRDIKKQNTDLQSDYGNKVNEYNKNREIERQTYENRCNIYRNDIYKIKSKIYKYNQKTNTVESEIEQLSCQIFLINEKYKKDIQRASAEVVRLRSELAREESSHKEQNNDLSVAKLLQQIHQKEEREELSKKITKLTQLRNNLRTEIETLQSRLANS